MKKRVILIVIILLPLVSNAYDAKIDGIYYKFHYPNEAEVTFQKVENTICISDYSGVIVIPESVTYNNKTYNVTSIGDWAFDGCSSLTSITIPNSVTSIGYEAFDCCRGLTSVTIGNSVTSIGERAFYKCIGLTSVTIPNSVTSIGRESFRGCSGLTSLTIGNHVTNIGWGAFWECSGLTSITIPNSVTSIGSYAFESCSGLTSITIPNSVTSIGENAFFGCSGLTSVTVAVDDLAIFCNNKIVSQINSLIGKPIKLIDSEGKEIIDYIVPNSVTSIGKEAFYYCSGLTSVTIPNSVTSIGNKAFSDCSGLTSVTIPNSVTRIGDKAFSDCSGLNSITIPSSVISIGNEAFSGCSGLTSVTVAVDDLATFCNNYTVYLINSRIGKPIKLINPEGKEITDYIVPSNVTSIRDNAFRNCIGLTSITIPNSVTSIGDHTFSGCIGLTSIAIPNSVTCIGNSAFEGCIGLTSITIPNSVTSIGDHTFSGCIGLTSITIPNSVTNIYDYAFYGCAGLISIIIPYSVTIIGRGAFQGCSGLTSVIIPNSVKGIGVSAFESCNDLTSVTIPVDDLDTFCNNTIVYLINSRIGKPIKLINPEGKEITDYIVPTNVTNIGNNAFRNCIGLTSITIPNSVTSIGDHTFSGCIGLTSINIPNSVKSIGNSAFEGCIGLTSINIPNSVTSISDHTFRGCSSLNSLNIPDGVIYIGNYAFSDCIGLTSITIPNSVTRISDHTFRGCSSLNSLNIPGGVIYIGNSAFSDCSGLTSVIIPNSVKSIGSSAFEGCIGLTSVTVPVDDLDTFCNNKIVYLINTSIGKPIKLINSEEKEITDYIVPNNVTSIGDYAFRNCIDLTSFTIPNSVTTIGEEAFFGCSGLTSVFLDSNAIVSASRTSSSTSMTSIFGDQVREYVIGNSVKSIGSSAFSGCSGLNSINIPNSVTNIGSNAFYDCSALNSITIGNSVTSIGSNAFSGCSSLSKVIVPDIAAWCGVSFANVSANPLSNAHHIFSDGESEVTSLLIPDGVKSISKYTFYNCSCLTSITIPKSVTNIGDYAFEGCNGIKKVIAPDIAAWCGISFGFIFSNPLCYAHHIYSDENTEIINLVIPDDVKSIRKYAFYECSSLTTVSVGNGLKSIDDDAFCRCSSLTSINIPNSVTNIGGSAFSGCSSLTSINIPNSVTSIGDYAFYECSGLTFVTIGESVKSIGDRAFYGCSSLTSINIPESVTSIGDYGFYGCTAASVTLESNAIVSTSRESSTSMKSIFGEQVKKYVLGNAIRSIGSNAFSGCSNMTSINIPPNVTSIGYRAFEDCSGLTSIIIPGGVTNIGSYAFRNCDLRNVFVKCPTPPYTRENSFTNQTYSHTILYVPTGTWDAYAYDKVWYKFNNIREIATAEGQLSMQQAYTLMDANDFTYSVYDKVNNCISTTNADGIDENNPNHSWQLMKANGKHYLYNIGAKKYVQKNGNGFDLIDTPRPINVGNGDNGIILGEQASQHWALVSNEHVNVSQSAIDEITSIGNKVDMVISNAGYSTFYDSRYAYTLPNGLSAQVVTNASNGKLTYSTIADGNTAGIVPKGTAVMLVSDTKRSGTFSLTVTAENAPYSGTNLLCGSDETTMTSGNGLHYKLSYGQTGTKWNDVFGWYWGAQNGAPFQIEGHKAWLVVSGGSTRAAGFTIDGDATEIIDIVPDNEGCDIYYDIQGRRISTPTRSGIYIKNGKKVIIK